MPNGFFDSNWSGAFEDIDIMSLSLGSSVMSMLRRGADPIEELPKTPIQSPIVDPAQEAFQFPFQYPPQDPGQGESQYAPVDVPENQLQENFDPLEEWNEFSDLGADAFKWAERFNPTATQVTSASEIGKGIVEQQGFDLGTLDENLGGAWSWIDDLFQGTGNEVPNQENRTPEDIAKEMDVMFSERLAAGESPEDIRGSEEMMGLREEYTQMQESRGVTAESPTQPESDVGVAESPASQQASTMAITGADITAPEIATGEIKEAIGLDVLPSATELIGAILRLL